MHRSSRLSLVAALALGACHAARPATPPMNTAGDAGDPPAAPATTATTAVTLDGVTWTVAADGTVDDTEGGQRVTTPGFTLTVMAWPRSDAFVETLTEHLDGARQTDPALEVLHQADQGRYHFEAVLRTQGAIDGTVLVPSPTEGDGAMCGFKLAADADWHAALAACQSLATAP